MSLITGNHYLEMFSRDGVILSGPVLQADRMISFTLQLRGSEMEFQWPASSATNFS